MSDVGIKVPKEELLKNDDIRKFLESGTPAMLRQPLPPEAGPQPPPPADVAPTPDFNNIQVEPPAPEPTPQELYLQGLAKLNISKEEASRVIDTMITQGFYEEEMPVTKTVKVKFRTRYAEAADRLNAAINQENPSFSSTLYALIGKYNLAASLVGYGKYNFDPSTPEGFQKNMDYIRTKIPLPIYQILLAKLAKFDEKMGAILTEGCIEHFF